MLVIPPRGGGITYRKEVFLYKELSDMTLVELWELFPITLSEHKDCWEEWFVEEKNFLQTLLNNKAEIFHIGSTAVKNIKAKPIVDIIITADKNNFEFIKNTLINNGYICMAEANNRISFNKGYTKFGYATRVFHIHLRKPQDDKEIYFCKYLQENPKIAKEYEALKMELWKKYPKDRDGYTEAKGSFINEHTKKAIKLYKK